LIRREHYYIPEINMKAGIAKCPYCDSEINIVL